MKCISPGEAAKVICSDLLECWLISFRKGKRAGEMTAVTPAYLSFLLPSEIKKNPSDLNW